MKKQIDRLALVLFLSGVGCGGNAVPASGAADHSLESVKSVELAQGKVHQFPFTLPTNAVVTYTITDAGLTPPDHWNVAIVAPSEWSKFQSGQPSKGYVVRNDASTVTATGQVPAGSYSFGIICIDIEVHCFFALELSALY